MLSMKGIHNKTESTSQKNKNKKFYKTSLCGTALHLHVGGRDCELVHWQDGVLDDTIALHMRRDGGRDEDQTEQKRTSEWKNTLGGKQRGYSNDEDNGSSKIVIKPCCGNRTCSTPSMGWRRR